MRKWTPRDSIVLRILEELESERPAYNPGSQPLANRIAEHPEYDIDVLVQTGRDEDHLSWRYTIHRRSHTYLGETSSIKDRLEREELEVPSIPSMVACLLTPRADSDGILGDLDEKYRKHSERHGARFANLWYWWQVGSLIGPWVRSVLLWIGGLADLKKALDWIGKLGGS